MNTRHLIDLDDFSLGDITRILNLARDIKRNPAKYAESCRGKIMATLFYEPSTRTQMSFQTAMYRLGGQIIGFDDPGNSSVAKGESLKDTIRIVSGYSDIVVMRHNFEGSAKAASLYCQAPLINAGDGGHLHPTQTLTDLLTLREETGRLSNLTIGLCGDLKNGRTVHSLIKTMLRFKDNRFVLISTPDLRIPSYLLELIKKSGAPYEECASLEEAMPKLDVLYMTRIQRERFASEAEYLAQRSVYVLDEEKLALGKADLKVLHPLPRVDEITNGVDDDPRAIYFDQAVYGMYVRMALIVNMLYSPEEYDTPAKTEPCKYVCTNPRCITITEEYLPKNLHLAADGSQLCEYCEHHV